MDLSAETRDPLGRARAFPDTPVVCATFLHVIPTRVKIMPLVK